MKCRLGRVYPNSRAAKIRALIAERCGEREVAEFFGIALDEVRRAVNGRSRRRDPLNAALRQWRRT